MSQLSAWPASIVVEAAARGLQRVSCAGTQRQDVYGLDSLREVQLHVHLAEGLAAAGWGVKREWPYPGAISRRAKHRERERCDFVLLPRPGDTLIDPVAELVEHDKGVGTLFENAAPPRSPGQVRPEDAYWLEVKTVGQHTFTDGVPGPNTAYSSELVRGIAGDLAKLAQEAFVQFGGVLLVHFAEDLRVHEHDLQVAVHRALDRGLPIRSPVREWFEIPDRIGNRVCGVALIEITSVR